MTYSYKEIRRKIGYAIANKELLHFGLQMTKSSVSAAAIARSNADKVKPLVDKAKAGTATEDDLMQLEKLKQEGRNLRILANIEVGRRKNAIEKESWLNSRTIRHEFWAYAFIALKAIDEIEMPHSVYGKEDPWRAWLEFLRVMGAQTDDKVSARYATVDVKYRIPKSNSFFVRKITWENFERWVNARGQGRAAVEAELNTIPVQDRGEQEQEQEQAATQTVQVLDKAS